MKKCLSILVVLLFSGCSLILSTPVSYDAQYTFTTHEEDHDFENPIISTSVSYPVMQYPTHTDKGVIFNEAIKNIVDEKTQTFMTDLKENWLDQDALFQTESEIDVEVHTTLMSNDIVSLQFDIYSYYSGAAHGNPYSFGFIFDLDAENELTFNDLFVVEQDEYLSTLSELSRKILIYPNESGKDMDYDVAWINTGTEPKLENFHTVVLTPTGLGVTFDSYDIGPYARGPYQIIIPTSKLQSILDPHILEILEWAQNVKT